MLQGTGREAGGREPTSGEGTSGGTRQDRPGVWGRQAGHDQVPNV